MNTSLTKKKISCAFDPRLALAALILAALSLGGCATGPDRNAPPAVADVPNFLWLASSNQAKSSRAFRGQPMVILIANKPDQRNVRGQAKRLEKQYRDFAGMETVFIAAFTEAGGRVPSDIPFAYAAEPVKLAEQMGATGDFTLYVVAKDGSVAQQTNKVQSGQRVLDILVNSRPAQMAENR